MSNRRGIMSCMRTDNSMFLKITHAGAQRIIQHVVRRRTAFSPLPTSIDSTPHLRKCTVDSLLPSATKSSWKKNEAARPKQDRKKRAGEPIYMYISPAVFVPHFLSQKPHSFNEPSLSRNQQKKNQGIHAAQVHQSTSRRQKTQLTCGG